MWVKVQGPWREITTLHRWPSPCLLRLAIQRELEWGSIELLIALESLCIQRGPGPTFAGDGVRVIACPKRIEMKSRRTPRWRVGEKIWSSKRSLLFNFLLYTVPERLTCGFGGREFERQTDWYLEMSLIWWKRGRVLSWSHMGEDTTCKDTSHVLCRIFWKNREWLHWALIGQRLGLLSKLNSDWLATSNAHKRQKGITYSRGLEDAAHSEELRSSKIGGRGADQI